MRRRITGWVVNRHRAAGHEVRPYHFDVPTIDLGYLGVGGRESSIGKTKCSAKYLARTRVAVKHSARQGV